MLGTGTRVGVVLGAGGLTAAAFHAGALAALELEYGWDASTSSLIVGTSAGALTAAHLAAGVSASEIMSVFTGGPDLGHSNEVVRRMRERPSFPDFSLRDILRSLRPPNYRAVQDALRLPGRSLLGSALATIVPPGPYCLGPHLRHFDEEFGKNWSSRLWLCATELPSGARRVLGRDAVPFEPRLSDAIAASCALPGLFEPVSLDGRPHVDGGIRSPTNADVAADAAGRLDLVIVSSPMSGPATPSRAAFRRRAGRLVRREVARLDAAGIRTVLLEPAIGVGPRTTRQESSDALGAIALGAFFGVGDLAARLADVGHSGTFTRR